MGGWNIVVDSRLGGMIGDMWIDRCMFRPD